MNLKSASSRFLFVAIVLFAATILFSQTAKKANPQPRAENAQLVASVKGPDLFRAYCASCHGATGQGKGPVAAALKDEVPDLTLISLRNGGKFPTARVRTIIAGDDAISAHGSRKMPVWGPVFHQVEQDQDWGNVRLENLAKYLESIQKK